MISVSIVSHGQAALAKSLIEDLVRCCEGSDIELILTLNLPEELCLSEPVLDFPLKIIRNTMLLGFGANHNQAFERASGEYFCVLNPDISLLDNPFPVLVTEIMRKPAGVIAPAVFTPFGGLEDSVRRFPTPRSLAAKLLGRGDGHYGFAAGDATFTADWLGGMFMLFRSDDFRAVGGFDEAFFLYYEDVDICARLWRAGRLVLACPKAQVIHDARRASRNSWRYRRWHAASVIRYFIKYWGRLPRTTAC